MYHSRVFPKMLKHVEAMSNTHGITRSKSSNAFRTNRAGSEAYDFPVHSQFANPSKRQIEGQNVEFKANVIIEKHL